MLPTLDNREHVAVKIKYAPSAATRVNKAELGCPRRPQDMIGTTPRPPPPLVARPHVVCTWLRTNPPAVQRCTVGCRSPAPGCSRLSSALGRWWTSKCPARTTPPTTSPSQGSFLGAWFPPPPPTCVPPPARPRPRPCGRATASVHARYPYPACRQPCPCASPGTGA